LLRQQFPRGLRSILVDDPFERDTGVDNDGHGSSRRRSRLRSSTIDAPSSRPIALRISSERRFTIEPDRLRQRAAPPLRCRTPRRVCAGLREPRRPNCGSRSVPSEKTTLMAISTPSVHCRRVAPLPSSGRRIGDKLLRRERP
jgi:hypothetical protein